MILAIKATTKRGSRTLKNTTYFFLEILGSFFIFYQSWQIFTLQVLKRLKLAAYYIIAIETKIKIQEHLNLFLMKGFVWVWLSLGKIYFLNVMKNDIDISYKLIVDI